MMDMTERINLHRSGAANNLNPTTNTKEYTVTITDGQYYDYYYNDYHTTKKKRGEKEGKETCVYCAHCIETARLSVVLERYQHKSKESLRRAVDRLSSPPSIPFTRRNAINMQRSFAARSSSFFFMFKVQAIRNESNGIPCRRRRLRHSKSKRNKKREIPISYT